MMYVYIGWPCAKQSLMAWPMLALFLVPYSTRFQIVIFHPGLQ